MIAVCIATYNHEAFIAQAIESVLMQQCDEPLRLYIGDDASSDGTAAICRQYAQNDPRIVYIRQPQNIGLVANTLSLYRCIMADGCAYIAMLDGDDYWTDSDKLHIQTDYLRAHPQTGFVHTGAYELSNGQQTLLPATDIPIGDLSERYDLPGARQTNSTVMFRAALLDPDDLEAIQAAQFPVLDYPLYGILAQSTSFAYLHSPTAVWRHHDSVSEPVRWRAYARYRRERIRMWKWLDNRYPKHFHYTPIAAFKWFCGQVIAFFYEKMQ